MGIKLSDYLNERNSKLTRKQIRQALEELFTEGETIMKRNTDKEIKAVFEKGIEEAEKVGIDVGEDEYLFIQPFSDEQAIIVTVGEEDGKRGIKVKVTNTVIVLEKKDGTLDCFYERKD